MLKWFRDSTSVGAAITVLTVGGLTVGPIAGQQTPAYRAPRLIGTQNPNLNGIWEVLNTANWDLEAHGPGPSAFPALLGTIGAEPPGQSVIEGGKIPYQP